MKPGGFLVLRHLTRQSFGCIRRWFPAAALVLLTACTAREVVMYGDPHPDAEIEVMYVATQHALGGSTARFGQDRNFTLNHFRAEVSVPPGHVTGRIEWPGGTPDAARNFVVTDSRLLADGAHMARALDRERTNSEMMVFVHGYNNTLSEAMYRFALIKADFEVEGPSVLFAWQSAGAARGYIYDRDSVLFARSDLVRTLESLTGDPGETVFLLAHSMGAQLTMEALREIALRGDHRILQRLSGVVLISPDIDPDLFRSQMAGLGNLPVPILIVVSRSDRALGLASFITGKKERLGLISSADQVRGLNVQVIDITALDDGSGLGHFTAATSPAAVTVLRGLSEGLRAGDASRGQFVVLAPEAVDR